MRTLCRIVVVLLAAVAVQASAADSTSPSPRPSFSQPTISPNGGTIAFVSGGAIWEVPAAGGVARILVADKGADSRPLFSPDGKHLAFVSDATGDGDIYVIDLATGRLMRVTHADGRDQLSGWSHDGQWVYFNASRDNIGGMSGVYRVRITGGTPMPVSLEPYRFEEQGVPSPDNQTVALIDDNLYALLAHRIGHKTTLRLATNGHTRKVELKPINSRTLAMLDYRAWVNVNRAYVAKISGGKLGYVHLPDMSLASLHRLYRELDAHNMTRDGVVIDVRNNFGGFVNAYVLDVLSRRAYLNMTPRGLGHAVPARSLLGQRALERPTVLITNRITLSDGEDFTEGYRELHLGKVVGEPTAGWIIFTGAGRLIDGATVRLPFSTITTADGKPMERHPRPVDVPVTRPLGQSYRDQDSDLDVAVKTLLQQIAAQRNPAAAQGAHASM